LLQDILGYLRLALDIFVPVTPVEEQMLNSRADSRVLLNRANKTVDFLAGEADELVGFGKKEGVPMPAYQEEREKVSWPPKLHLLTYQKKDFVR
jgi:hypothetical protein